MEAMAYDFDRCLREGQRLKTEGAPLENILLYFRTQGATMTECMKLLKQIENISLGEAKRIVHFSETWEDFRASSEELQEQAEQAAREVERESADGGYFEKIE